MTGSEARRIATWQAPLADGGTSEELVLSFDRQRERRVLILPALFDEANKMRRFTVQVMRAADKVGLDTFLPDLPGCNESLEALESQTLASLRGAALAAAKSFQATHVLAIRAGALFAPANLVGWHYAPLTGAKVMRGMLRARVIASREAGREETPEALLEQGRKEGLILAGWPIGAEFLRELELAEPHNGGNQTVIEQKTLGGAGLWLRAEPGEDDAASHALASFIAGDAQ